jgi:glycerophosphoryl diester phosphodiesterase
VKNLFLSVLLLLMMFGISMPAQVNKVLITAHRGASGHAPENTLSSMNEAINMHADFAELDAQETTDGEIIILHDDDLKRTTGLVKNIWETTYEEIKTLDAGNWFGEKFKNEPLPKLSDVIDFVRGKIKLNIELKTNGHEKMLADRVVKIIQDKHFSKECFFTSFDYSQIKRVKEIDPDFKVGLIFKAMPTDIDVFTVPVEALNIHFSLLNSEFIKKAKENGKEVHVWTVNEESEMKRIIDFGVTSIITNYPDRLKKILDENK